MVFSFFFRKSQQQQNVGVDEAGPSSSSLASSTSVPQQLHTPAPSIDVKQTSPSPVPGPADTPSPPPEDQVTDPTTLYGLISSVPAQTLHAYTLLHLSPPPPSPFPVVLSTPALLGQAKPIAPPSPRTLTILTEFFSSLKPPPQLHCVRCHKGYFELENADTSCRIAHDDDSATVERVKTGLGSEYETLWGCCGKTVEGDGDMGPPDGWCYEGQHTADVKRARFRADSTVLDDRLPTCASLRCHEPPAPPRPSRGRGGRKRKVTEVDHDEDEDDNRSLASSHTRSQSQSISALSNKGKGRAKTADDATDTEDAPKRPAKRQKSRKPSTSMRPTVDGDGDIDMDAAINTPPTPASPPKPTQRRKKSTNATTTKPISKSSADNRPILKSPLSASFTASTPPPVTVPISRASTASPTRKGVASNIMEVSISRKGSLASLKAKGSLASLKGAEDENKTGARGRATKSKASTKKALPSVTNAKALGEIIDTSVDGEQWS